MKWGKKNDKDSKIDSFESLPETPIESEEETQAISYTQIAEPKPTAIEAPQIHTHNKQAHARSSTSSKPISTIGRSVRIQGTLQGEEDVTILGYLKGEVILKNNNLVIGRSGHIEANVVAQCIAVEGEVVGDLFATHASLRKNGRVIGNINAPRIAIDDGAEFKGNIDMDAAVVKNKLGEPDRITAPAKAGQPNQGTAVKTQQTKPSASTSSPKNQKPNKIEASVVS